MKKIEPIKPENLEPCMEKRLVNEHEIVHWINMRLSETVPFSQADKIVLLIPTSNDYLMTKITEKFINAGWKISAFTKEGFWIWEICPLIKLCKKC